MWLNFPFQKFSMFRRIPFVVFEKKTAILIIKVMIKNLCNLSNEKTQHSFYLNHKGAGEEVCGRGVKGCKEMEPGGNY